MDNREIRIQSEGRPAFDMALALMFDNAPGRSTSHFTEVAPSGIESDPPSWKTRGLEGHVAKTLVLFWHKPDQWRYLGEVRPRKLNLQRAQKFVWEWLERQERRDDHLSDIEFDGSQGSGFLIFNERWGHVGDSFYAFAAIRPIWAWYGK